MKTTKTIVSKRDLKVRKKTPSHGRSRVHVDKTKYNRKGGCNDF